MAIDDRALEGLLEESQDLHSDAMHHGITLVPDLTDAHSDARDVEIDPAEIAEFNDARRTHVEQLGLGTGGAARVGVMAGGLGALLAAMLAAPASAGSGKRLDIAATQTASGLELLAVATYGAALSLPFIDQGNAVVKKFAETTLSQHDEHRQAFQAQSVALGGKKQKKPSAKYVAVVEAAKPGLATPLDVVTLAATLETVATHTYLNNLSLLNDRETAALFGSVQGVESQHLATLRAVGALLQANAPELIAIPVDAAQLPAAAGSVAFPEPFEPTTMASPPEEGAVR